MKILIVMAGFFPGKKYGGPPVSIDNFCSLMKEHECYIITLDHDLGETQKYKYVMSGWNNRGNCKVLYVSDSEYNRATFEQVIGDMKPDIVYLQGLFQSCVLPCLQLAKKHTIPVLLAPRGELCEGALNINKWKKIPYIEAVKVLGLVRKIHWQSTSDEETAAIKKLMKAQDSHIHRLDNIPSIPKKEYPARDKAVGEGRFVFLSRIHQKKNLLFAISLFKEIEGKAKFDIYGPIEDEAYWQLCQEEIKKLPESVKVEYKGLVSHDQVHEVFSQYDAFLFPTLSENYGHVIAESLMVGTPVIISDQTPWTDVNENNTGWAYNLKEEGKFQEAIRHMILFDKDEIEQLSITTKKFARHKMNLSGLRSEYEAALETIAEKL